MILLSSKLPGGDKDALIEINRNTEEFKAAAKALSDFMDSLNLPADKHNRLVELTIAQVDAAEHGAYIQGVGLGLDYAQFEAAERAKTDDNGKGVLNDTQQRKGACGPPDPRHKEGGSKGSGD